MSQYDEICRASSNAVKTWNEYRERSWGYLSMIVRGLITHCGVPQEKITFLRSNELPGEQRRYRPPEDRGLYTLPGAVTFDEEDNSWHLGVAITLSPAGTFPERWVGVVLCVTENNGQATVRLGKNGKPRTIDFNDPHQCADLCDEIAEFLRAAFDDPRKITEASSNNPLKVTGAIGFVTQANPQQGEKQEKPAIAGG
jgi:hypothetical protein